MRRGSAKAAEAHRLTYLRARACVWVGKQALERSLAQWEREVVAARTDAEKLSMELAALDKEEAELRANLSVFEAEATARPEDVKRVKELRAALDLNERALAKAKAKSDSFEERCKELQVRAASRARRKPCTGVLL